MTGDVVEADDAQVLRAELPERSQLLWPSLLVLRAHRGGLTVSDHDQLVAAEFALNDDHRQLLTRNGKDREFSSRMRSARNSLKEAGLITNAGYGVWEINGSAAFPQDEQELLAMRKAARRQRRDTEATAQRSDDQHQAHDATRSEVERLASELQMAADKLRELETDDDLLTEQENELRRRRNRLDAEIEATRRQNEMLRQWYDREVRRLIEIGGSR